MRFFITSVFIVFYHVLFSQIGILKGECVDKKGNRLPDVKILYIKNDTSVFYTSDGLFNLEIPKNTRYRLVFEYDELEVEKIGYFDSRNVINLKKIVFNINAIEEEIVIRGETVKSVTRLPMIDLQRNNTTTERFLVYGAVGVSSNNELTSNYNVRGGNYDENLVYVNGFNINRPFLTRSGQQEGLSFINTALVNDIRFSAGGFDSRYGDKLSSVLDIDYKIPDSLNYSLMLSLLGTEAHVAHNVNSRFNYVAAARYRANGYLLNSMPTKGNYNPVFYDAQTLLNYSITEKLLLSTIVHFSSNNYRFAPETQTADFGVFNEAYQLKIYYDGQEQSKFQTMTAGTALKWAKSKNTQLDLYFSIFNTQEKEYFDINGQYFINQLETNITKENAGDSIGTLGVGSTMTHARNKLSATIINLYHNGTHNIGTRNHFLSTTAEKSTTQKIQWGFNLQKDLFQDKLSEWKLVDSTGYSMPVNFFGPLELNEVIKGNLSINSSRYSAYVQHQLDKKNLNIAAFKTVNYKDSLGRKLSISDTVVSSSRFIVNSGLRMGYTAINDEFYITPRVSLIYSPDFYYVSNGKIHRRNVQFRLSSGLYYQPPFYREFRTFNGQLNLDVKAQKSLHIVAGSDYYFNMWGRKTPFKFTAEAYYKYLWDVNPYEIDNVRTRYYANNNATGYMYGLDLNVYGEFVDGVHSFFKLGLMQAKEDVKGDQYTNYYNSDGQVIYPGMTENDVVTDSLVVNPGYIPRPTDQLLNMSILFQDKMPGIERLTAQLGLIFNTALPYGPPDFERYKDTLRMKSYFRVDLGISYDLLDKTKTHKKKVINKLSDAILSFEVFNLMGINNMMSKQWVQDINGMYYAVPNYLTSRRFNLKLIMRF